MIIISKYYLSGPGSLRMGGYWNFYCEWFKHSEGMSPVVSYYALHTCVLTRSE